MPTSRLFSEQKIVYQIRCAVCIKKFFFHNVCKHFSHDASSVKILMCTSDEHFTIPLGHGRGFANGRETPISLDSDSYRGAYC